MVDLLCTYVEFVVYALQLMKAFCGLTSCLTKQVSLVICAQHSLPHPKSKVVSNRLVPSA